MNKTLLTLTILAACTVLIGCNKTVPNKTVSAQLPANSQNAVKAPTVQLASTTYVPYTESAYKKAQADGKDVALFFHSKTCGSCAKLNENIEDNLATMPENTVVFKTDWDDNQELAKERKVETYHTVSYDSDAGVKNVKGLFTLNDLVAEIK